VDEESAAVAGAEIDVRSAKPFTGGTTGGNVFGNQHPVSDLGGRFEIRLRLRGEPPAGEVRLEVTRQGSRGRVQKTVAVGTQGLVIVLTRGGRMLRFLHPDGTPTGRAAFVTGTERVITVEDRGAVQSFPIEIPEALIEVCLKSAGQ
jgi:hypothetical protein